jgi:hypothetical protein
MEAGVIPVEFKFPEPVGIVRAQFDPDDLKRLFRAHGHDTGELRLTVPFGWDVIACATTP